MRREGLGGRHANLDASTCDVSQLAFAHHRRGGDVADGQSLRHAQALRVAQCGQCVGGFTALRDGDDQGACVRYAGAVAVFAGDFHLRWNAGNAFQPVLGGAAAVVAGAAGQDQHRIDVLEGAVSSVAKQLGDDGVNAFQRVGDGARLLKNFFLHVVAIRPEFGRAAVRLDGFDLPLDGLVLAVKDPVFAKLNVDQISLFKVDDLIGHAGQRHRVAGQKVLSAVFAHA